MFSDLYSVQSGLTSASSACSVPSTRPPLVTGPSPRLLPTHKPPTNRVSVLPFRSPLPLPAPAAALALVRPLTLTVPALHLVLLPPPAPVLAPPLVTVLPLPVNRLAPGLSPHAPQSFSAWLASLLASSYKRQQCALALGQFLVCFTVGHYGRLLMDFVQQCCNYILVVLLKRTVPLSLTAPCAAL